MASFARTAGIVALMLVTPAHPAFAQQAPASGVERQPQPTVVASDVDAREIREQFEVVLRRLPPAVGRVLKTDPTLMSNEAYLAPYPALGAFLKQHPEVVRNSGYYLANVSGEFYEPRGPVDPRELAVNMWRETLEGLAIFSVFAAIAACLIWIIRTIIEQRRWSRVSKVQTEVHTKLLDRFTANEDLLAYMQTPAGRRFLEAAPLAVEGPARAIAAPLSRILWSVQAGVVLAAGALGVLFISTQVIDEAAQPLFAIGVLGLTVGVGFIASAGASYLISRRLGLLEREQAAELPQA